MKKALATFIDIYYQLLLYYIAELKDSFKVYCYENVQKYRKCSGYVGGLIPANSLYFMVLFVWGAHSAVTY